MKALKRRIAWVSCVGLIAIAVMTGCSTSDVTPEDVAPGPNAAPGGSNSGGRPVPAP